QATSRCPQRENEHSIPSSLTICSTQSIEASDVAYIRCVRSLPYMEISLLTPNFRPVSTMPPLRELAPHPMVSASRTATVALFFARVRAPDKPVYPAPITATSTSSGSGRAALAVGIPAVVSQQLFAR